MRRRRWWLLLAAAALLLLAAWVVWGVWRSGHRPVARTWQVEAGLPVRLAVLSDLHGCVFGEHNGELAALVAEQEPDLILLDGDMLNGDAPGQRTCWICWGSWWRSRRSTTPGATMSGSTSPVTPPTCGPR